ncbi:ArnT family glycosyltransferase [Spirosoma fluviale]|uniref:Dolichyl-phosphate-mannose-protein mannosyltransferase n=1 Tax=Spirosoma fluviale TaxID=1597977 RepID=A0A286FIZ7_9BACT|nr:glycosyltransferase family 39 protein [Spirosoma fluviale]SOD83205.1 Dolichyl-phosphate-mannose-protein mannosyltransferase [Spirosoma fluviale]
MSSLYLIPLVLFVIYVGRLSSQVCRRSLTEWWLTTFLLGAGSVILTGFVLSGLYLTANTPVWAGSVFITATILGKLLSRLSGHKSSFSVRQLAQERFRTGKDWFGGLSAYSRFLFILLLSTLGIIAVTNLLLVLFTVPNEWDSMTGHLNRVMQYVQRGTMRHFGGTNWNMDTYPKSVCTLQIYSFLMTGHFENGFKFIHHLSYWTAIVAVFGIVQRIGQNRLSASFFCALAYALLPDFLMQAITTETDIVLTAYLSVLLYMLFTYRSIGLPTADNRYLYLAGMAFGIAFGHKITFALLLPSVFVIMIYTVFLSSSWVVTFGRVWRLGLAIGVGVCLWTLPTGYLKNIEVFGHPIGPPTALKHQSVERAGSLGNLLEQGSRNVVRYAYDHVNLDGIRNVKAGADLNHAMRKPLVLLEDKLHMRLDEETDFSIQTFAFDRKFVFYNANPYWGIFGFGLILPLLVLVLVGYIRSTPHIYLGVALLLHFLALSYSAPYDPFKGRYFIETGLFGVTFLALLFLHPRTTIDTPKRPIWKGYVALVTVLGCLSALMCVFLNTRALPFAWTGPDGAPFPSAFTSDRIRQITIGRPDTYTPFKRFDELVPDSATVALATINDDYEYPLYGPKLSRRLIAINPFEQGLKPIPKEADYLFFDKSVIAPQPGDIRLGTDTTLRAKMIVPGEDYYLRKLKKQE